MVKENALIIGVANMSLFKKNIAKLSDEVLMLHIQKKNDQMALTELYARYSQKILGYFINMFKGDVALAEDFLQDLFMKVMVKSHQFDTDKKFYAWVFTIASNMCKTHFLQAKKMKIVVGEEADLQVNAINIDALLSNAFDKKVFKIMLREQIDQLTYDHRVIFILRYHQSFTLKEIAEITETNIGTVKSRLYYATKYVTDGLKEFDPNQQEQLFKIK